MPFLDFSVWNIYKVNQIGSLRVEKGWRRFSWDKGGEEGGGGEGRTSPNYFSIFFKWNNIWYRASL